MVCVVFDDSLVKNGQQTSYGPCGLGAVDRDGSEEVCVAACGCSGAYYCACLSAHDALAAVYAAERTCAGSCRCACEFRTRNNIPWGKCLFLFVIPLWV